MFNFNHSWIRFQSAAEYHLHMYIAEHECFTQSQQSNKHTKKQAYIISAFCASAYHLM